MKESFLLVALLFFVHPAYGQNRVWRAITTHKVEIFQGILTVTGRALVTEASIHCQNVAPTTCVERGGVGLGAHPSSTATRAFGYTSAGVMIGLNRFWHHETAKVKSDGKDDKDLDVLAWGWVIPLFTFDVVSAHDDWKASRRLR